MAGGTLGLTGALLLAIPTAFVLESKSELKMLRAFARASFSGDSKIKEVSASYTYRIRSVL